VTQASPAPELSAGSASITEHPSQKTAPSLEEPRPGGAVGGRAGTPPAQRLRVVFAKEARLRFIGHLDVVRLWERAGRRAGLPLAYSLGFTPRPRLQFAAPLALGATGAAEVVDVFLTGSVTPDRFAADLGAQLPPGCRIVSVAETDLAGPAVSARLRWADYRVLAAGAAIGPVVPETAGPPAPRGSRWSRGATVPVAVVGGAVGGSDGAVGGPDGAVGGPDGAVGGPDGAPAVAPGEAEVPWRPAAERQPRPDAAPPAPPADVVAGRIAAVLAATTLPRQRERDGKMVAYDLRRLIVDLWLETAEGDPDGATDLQGTASAGAVAIGMRLLATPQGQGRPDEVAAALGLQARRIHRRGLGLEA
jgi:hypothetical protein